jgi:hypothetical protein
MMNVDDLLRFLAPVAPAVLPIMVFIWHRTRRELRQIRGELTALRTERGLSDPRLDELLEAMDGMRTELVRLGEAQRSTLRLVADQEARRSRLTPGAMGEVDEGPA